MQRQEKKLLTQRVLWLACVLVGKYSIKWCRLLILSKDACSPPLWIYSSRACFWIVQKRRVSSPSSFNHCRPQECSLLFARAHTVTRPFALFSHKFSFHLRAGSNNFGALDPAAGKFSSAKLLRSINAFCDWAAQAIARTGICVLV